jgi:hypothetical protein
MEFELLQAGGLWAVRKTTKAGFTRKNQEWFRFGASWSSSGYVWDSSEKMDRANWTDDELLARGILAQHTPKTVIKFKV